MQCENADRTLHKLYNLNTKKTDNETLVEDKDLMENDIMGDHDKDDDNEDQEEENTISISDEVS